MSRDRIEREIAALAEGAQIAQLIDGPPLVVVYRGVPTAGASFGLPNEADVVVPVPGAYPTQMIDGAALEEGSPFLPRVKGGQNAQGFIMVNGKRWQLASYHPHNGGGGPAWNPTRHGFHTYFDHLIAWLNRLN